MISIAKDVYLITVREMTDSSDKKWQEFFNNTAKLPPSPLLVKAIEFVNQKNKAIDIGAGALKDTRYLLSEGFNVTAVDSAPELADMVKEFGDEIDANRLAFAVTTFSDFPFPANKYDLASAQYALPFCPPEDFDKVFDNIKNSLAKGGIFTGQFFGIHDEWSTRPNMTFHDREAVEKLLAGMDIILLEEKEFDGKLANGTPKHWHLFNVIARK